MLLYQNNKRKPNHYMSNILCTQIDQTPSGSRGYKMQLIWRCTPFKNSQLSIFWWACFIILLSMIRSSWSIWTVKNERQLRCWSGISSLWKHNRLSGLRNCWVSMRFHLFLKFVDRKHSLITFKPMCSSTILFLSYRFPWTLGFGSKTFGTRCLTQASSYAQNAWATASSKLKNKAGLKSLTIRSF